jgi:hypothetical protein
VLLAAGQRSDGETAAGTIDMLCAYRYTDIGDGATYHSASRRLRDWIELEIEALVKDATESSSDGATSDCPTVCAEDVVSAADEGYRCRYEDPD